MKPAYTPGTLTVPPPHGGDALAQGDAAAGFELEGGEYGFGGAALGFEAHGIDGGVHAAVAGRLFDDGLGRVVDLVEVDRDHP